MKKESPRKSRSPINPQPSDADDPDRDGEHEIDPEHRPQDGANLMAPRQPVGERAGRRLLERPEEHDHEQEQRCPENGDETVGLGTEHAGREHVVGVGEDPGRDGRSRRSTAPSNVRGALGRVRPRRAG